VDRISFSAHSYTGFPSRRVFSCCSRHPKAFSKISVFRLSSRAVRRETAAGTNSQGLINLKYMYQDLVDVSIGFQDVSLPCSVAIFF